MEKSRTVDEYLSRAPQETRKLAGQLREIIKKSAPQATEKISYQIPYYGFNGRLIYFGVAKDHVSLYVMSATRAALRDELEPYRGRGTKATYKFYLDKPLPVALIKKIIKTQLEANLSATNK